MPSMPRKHYVIVKGFALPARLGGHPALDFCNTRAGWDGPAEKDYLQRYDHLAVWAQYAALLPAARAQSLRDHVRGDERAGGVALNHARAVRTRLYRALLHPEDSGAIEALARDVRDATAHVCLATVRGAPAWEIDARAGLQAPIAAVLWAAAQLLTSGHPVRARACPGRGCGWLFLDPTGRRRWCTMATCGNREKARRFASRQTPTRSHAIADDDGAARGLGAGVTAEGVVLS